MNILPNKLNLERLPQEHPLLRSCPFNILIRYLHLQLPSGGWEEVDQSSD